MARIELPENVEGILRKRLDRQRLATLRGRGREVNVPEPRSIDPVLPTTTMTPRGRVSERISALREQPYVQEGKLKDIWDAFYLGGRELFHRSKQYFLSTLPESILGIVDEVPNTAVQKAANEIRQTFRKKYEASEAKYQQWLKQRPELRPRPEWDISPIEALKRNPQLFRDPGYWGYIMSRSASFSLGVLATSFAVGTATGNPLAGIAAGTAIATPSVSQDLFEDLVQSGATREQAASLSVPIGIVIAGVESVTDLPQLSAFSKTFKTAFRKSVTKEVAEKTVGYIVKKGIKKVAAIEAMEIAEEVVQGAIQDATVKFFDKNRSIIDNIPNTVLETAIATLPFAAVGGAAEVRQRAEEVGVDLPGPSVGLTIKDVSGEEEGPKKKKKKKEEPEFKPLEEEKPLKKEKPRELSKLDLEKLRRQKKQEVARRIIRQEEEAKERKAKLARPMTNIEKLTKEIRMTSDELKKEKSKSKKITLKKRIETLREQLKEQEKRKAEELSKKVEKSLAEEEILEERYQEPVTKRRIEKKLEQIAKDRLDALTPADKYILEQIRRDFTDLRTGEMNLSNRELIDELDDRKEKLQRKNIKRKGIPANIAEYLTQPVEKRKKGKVVKVDYPTIDINDKATVQEKIKMLRKDAGYMLNRLGSKHPDVVEINKAIDFLEKQLTKIDKPKVEEPKKKLVAKKQEVKGKEDLEKQYAKQIKIIKDAGLRYDGINFFDPKDKYPSIWFTEERSKTSGPIPVNEVTKANIAKRIREIERTFKLKEEGVKPSKEKRVEKPKEPSKKELKEAEKLVTEKKNLVKDVNKLVKAKKISVGKYRELARTVTSDKKGHKPENLSVEELKKVKTKLQATRKSQHKGVKLLTQISEDRLQKIYEGIMSKDKLEREVLLEAWHEIMEQAYKGEYDSLKQKELFATTQRTPVSMGLEVPTDYPKYDYEKDIGPSEEKAREIINRFMQRQHFIQNEIEFRKNKEQTPGMSDFYDEEINRAKRSSHITGDGKVRVTWWDKWKDFRFFFADIGIRLQSPEFIDEVTRFIFRVNTMTRSSELLIKRLHQHKDNNSPNAVPKKELIRIMTEAGRDKEVNRRLYQYAVSKAYPSDKHPNPYKELPDTEHYKNEQKVMDELMKSLERYKPHVRVQKFEKWLSAYESRSSVRPDHISLKEVEYVAEIRPLEGLTLEEARAKENKTQKEEIALEVYEELLKAADKFYERVDTRDLYTFFGRKNALDWGTKSGAYLPTSVFFKNLSLIDYKNAVKDDVMSEAKVKEENEKIYVDDDITPFHRAIRYIENAVFWEEVRPVAQRLENLLRLNADKFENINEIVDILKTHINEARGMNVKGAGLLYGIWRSIVSQASRTLILPRPDKYFRNTGQNPALAQRLSILFKKDNWKALSKEQQEFYEKNVDMFRSIRKEFFYLESDSMLDVFSKYMGPTLSKFSGLNIIKKLNDFARDIPLYGYTDTFNRLWMFKSEFNDTIRVIKENYDQKKSTGKDIEKMLNKTYYKVLKSKGLNIEALRIFMNDTTENKERFAEYLAMQAVNDTHFIYSRWQKSYGEQGLMGKTMLNMFTFNKSFMQRMLLDARKVVDLTYKPEKRTYSNAQAYDSLVNMIRLYAQAGVIGFMIASILGRNRQEEDDKGVRGFDFTKNNPYLFFNMIPYTLGGLGTAGSSQMGDLMFSTIDYVFGKNRRAGDKIPPLLSKTGDIFLPFYEQMFDVMEAFYGTKNMDMFAYRKVREMIDSQYEMSSKSRYEVRRTAFEAFQKAVFSAEVGDKVKTMKYRKVRYRRGGFAKTPKLRLPSVHTLKI